MDAKKSIRYISIKHLSIMDRCFIMALGTLEPSEITAKLTSHNTWLTSGGSSGERGDFSNLSLTSTTAFNTKDLTNLIFNTSVLYQVELTGVTLNSTLCGNTIFHEVSFTGATIENVTFQETSFIECDLNGITFTDCTFFGSVFDACNLTGATFDGCTFTGAEFSDCNLSDATLNNIEIY